MKIEFSNSASHPFITSSAKWGYVFGIVSLYNCLCLLVSNWCSGDNQNVGSSTPVVSRWLWPRNRTFLEVASLVVTWLILAFWRCVWALLIEWPQSDQYMWVVGLSSNSSNSYLCKRSIDFTCLDILMDSGALSYITQLLPHGYYGLNASR